MRPFAIALLLAAGCRSETGQRPVDEPEQPHLALILDTPAPASYLEIGPASVTGRYDNLGDLTLAGAPIQGVDGTFSGTVDLVRGTNRIEVTGRSGGGTTYAAHNAVIAGTFGDPDAPVEDGVRARLNRGGLKVLGTLAAEAVTPDLLRGALVTGEPLTAWSEGNTEVLVEITALDFADPTFAITPLDGAGRIDVSLYDLDLGVHLDATSGRFSASLDQRVTATRVRILGDLGVRVEGGVVRTSLTNVDVSLEGLQFDTSRLPSWLQGEFTDLVIQVVLEGVLRGVLPDLLPPLVDARLATLDLSFAATVLERAILARATPSAAAFDSDGLEIAANLAVTVDGVRARPAPGYLTSALVTPTVDRKADLALALRDDVLNLAAFHGWRADLIAARLSTDDESLPVFVFDALGGSRHGAVTVSADLPPTIVGAGDAIVAQVGELRVRIDTEDGANGEYLIAAASGEVALTPSVADGALTLAFGDTDLRLTVRDTDWTASLPEATAQIERLLPIELALGLLTDLSFPLPTLGPIAIAGAVTTRDPSGVHTRVAIDLAD
jgi:hypothetical protein